MIISISGSSLKYLYIKKHAVSVRIIFSGDVFRDFFASIRVQQIEFSTQQNFYKFFFKNFQKSFSKLIFGQKVLLK